MSRDQSNHRSVVRDALAAEPGWPAPAEPDPEEQAESILAFIERTLPALSLDQLQELQQQVTNRTYARDLERFGRPLADDLAHLDGGLLL